MRWWRWIVYTVATLACAASVNVYPAGLWVFVLALVVWPLRFKLHLDHASKLTDADIERLLNA